MPTALSPRLLAVLSSGAAIAAGVALATGSGAATRVQTTQLISRSYSGGVPNGPSTNGVISDDKRYARVIAFQSDASNIVRGDRDGVTDVFAIRRRGPVGNTGTPWRPGSTILVSKTFDGAPANGPSFAPAVDGSFHNAPSCVAFLSSASNLVPGDTNGVTDAFVSRGPGGKPQRVSLLPNDQQSSVATTQVAVSGDCSRIAFVAGGRLYVRKGGTTVALSAPGTAADPSFSTGLRNDLVFGAGPGVYLSSDGTGSPQLVAPGGANPAYNDIKRQVIAYVKPGAGLYYREHGSDHLVSGGGNATKPVIGNAGYYISFQRGANVYLYTDVRHKVLLESVRRPGRPIGGANPSMSFYANYILFDSGRDGRRQVLMRWLGGL